MGVTVGDETVLLVGNAYGWAFADMRGYANSMIVLAPSRAGRSWEGVSNKALGCVTLLVWAIAV